MDLVELVRGRARVAYARGGAHLEKRLRETSPRKTGELQRLTRVTPRGPLKLSVLVAAEYASYVRKGTAPHEIRPRFKKALAFFWEKVGENVIFARVHHPGTKANSWYDDALARFPADVEDELRRAP